LTTKSTRTIIAVRGDTQGGHAGGLLNPETELPDVDIDDDGKTVITGWHTPELRPVQKKLWEWHTQYIKDVKNLAGADEIVFIEMGDLTQGTVFKDDLDENNLNTQVTISRYNTIPWLDLPNVKSAFFVKGTGVHVWGEGSTERLLTAQLKAAYPRKRIEITDHWLLNVKGVKVDVSHHGPGPGIRNWTRGNAFELYVKSILHDDIEAGAQVPDVILRGHKHEFTYRRAIHQVRGRIWELPAFITPPMCFIGSHAQKVMNSPSYMGVGVLALEVINGKLHAFHPFTNYVDLRTREIA
jgi:hypothetical protein